MADEYVHYTNSGPVGLITLDRPPANSYDVTFMRQLDDAITNANHDENVKAVVVRSASSKFFSAGADIKAFMVNDTAANTAMIRVAHAALDKMAASEKVFIAAINGHALGGGLEMALACDLRFAAEGHYSLGLPEVTLGLLPGNGGTARLPRLIGANRALAMMITGERVTPAEALALGLVNRLVPAEALAEESEAYALRLATGATRAIAAIKRCVYDGAGASLADALALEVKQMAPLFDTADAAEGFRAFSEKRPPAFSGR
jgi:enoyl-CoA hydratase/carnithine racemase